ncbi:MAG: MFS transporter [Sporomusaceae bacterium]|nr:MFS transporter [Sporomusaceae bacterium]
MNREPDKKAVIVISLLTAACLLGDSMLYIVLPIYWQEVGLASLWEVGILLSVNRIVRLPFNPLVSWLYGKISNRSGVVLAGILAIGTTLSYAFIKGFALWLIFRCIWGIAWTFLRLGAYFTIIELSADNNRGYYMGMYNGLYRLGSLLGMLGGGFLAERYGIETTAILFGVMTCFAIPFTRQLPSGPNRQPQGSDKGQNISRLFNASVLWTLLTGLIIAMVYQGVFTATLSHLIQVHNVLPLSVSGSMIGAAPLAGLLLALRWSWEPWLAPWFGKLSDSRFGRHRLLVATLMLSSGCFSLITLSMPVVPWLLLIIGILLTATVLTTVIDAIACDVAACSPPKLFMSAYSFAIDIGAALGPVLSYALNDLAGPYAIYWTIAVALSLLAAKWLVRPMTGCQPS